MGGARYRTQTTDTSTGATLPEQLNKSQHERVVLVPLSVPRGRAAADTDLLTKTHEVCDVALVEDLCSLSLDPSDLAARSKIPVQKLKQVLTEARTAQPSAAPQMIGKPCVDMLPTMQEHPPCWCASSVDVVHQCSRCNANATAC